MPRLILFSLAVLASALASTLAPARAAHAQDYDWSLDLQRAGSTEIVAATTRNLTFLAVMSLASFHEEMRRHPGYTGGSLNEIGCVSYYLVLREEPWETHEVMRCPGGNARIAHGYNDRSRVRLRSFTDELVTALDPYFILHDGEANVYGFRSAGINFIVTVSSRAYEADVIVRQEPG